MTASPTWIDPWCRLLPKLHRALVDPEVACELPRPPQTVTHEEIYSYWETLHYLLRSILGWQDLAAGLAWWYAGGKQDHGDPRLSLINTVWDSEDQLDYFAAWAWSTKGWGPEVDASQLPHDACPSWIRNEWWKTFRRSDRAYQYDPYHGGGNPLHLGHSNDYGCRPSSQPCVGHLDREQRRAVLIVSDIECWRTELREFAAELPPVGDHSWYVEIFNRRYGYLGLFRQSRITGQWFQGKHSIHMAGQALMS